MAFDASKVDQMREQILAGKLNRRDVLKRSLALGLSAPVVASLLAACGGDDDDDDDDDDDEDAAADPTDPPAEDDEEEEEPTEEDMAEDDDEEEEPTEEDMAEDDDEEEDDEEEPAGERGGLGELKLLYWQAPTILNSHHSQGTKDFHAAQICLEPLHNLDSDANPILHLAAEWPSVEDETLAEDATWVIHRLRQDVVWHDGEPFDAEDVVFTWEYATSEEVASTTAGAYTPIESIDMIDQYTVQLNFAEPNPGWADLFMGGEGLILPEHILGDAISPDAREHEYHLNPIGTGPFRVESFDPGNVVQYVLFEDYWDPGKPHFDSILMEGGGDAPGAARAALVTGETDWAWNLQVEPSVLNQMVEEGEGTGELIATEANSLERLEIQFADPDEEVEGERAHISTQHPVWQHQEARQALSLLIDRELIASQLYGEGGVAAQGQFVQPSRLLPDTPQEYDPERAAELLESINFPDDFDDVNIVYQTSINSARQSNQEINKAAMEQVGFVVEIKAVEASVFFSGDPGNPDTTGHFYADLQMYTTGPSSTYPIRYCQRWRSDEICQRENNWGGDNDTRYQNPDFDALHDQARTLTDEAEQEEVWHEMLTIIYEDVVEIPTVARTNLAAKSSRLNIDDLNSSLYASFPVASLKHARLNE